MNNSKPKTVFIIDIIAIVALIIGTIAYSAGDYGIGLIRKYSKLFAC